MPHQSKKVTGRKTFSGTAIFYCFILTLTFLIGLGPMIFNLIMDPYEMNSFITTGLEKGEISKKAHYPLWKMSHFPQNTSDIIILGDSRANALKDNTWHELGAVDTYNFAYAGTTMLEIYDTFHYVKTSPNLKTLIIGIQLRSFDPDHKGRMNRVPEAVRLKANPLQYYSNWFVSGIGFKILEKNYGDRLQRLAALRPSLIATAHASDPKEEHPRNKPPKTLEDLLKPVVCASCLLPENVAPQQHSSYARVSETYFADKLGVWRHLWSPIFIDRTLPSKYDKQVRKNARSDWKYFNFSDDFWSYLVEISHWCTEHNIKLVFVIPPTIVEMQNRLVDFGHGALNHRFREDLAKLGLVVDFDFDNPVTRDLGRFRDAYHFNPDTSKLIIGEVIQLVSDDPAVIALAHKRRGDIICPLSEQDVITRTQTQFTEVLEGKSCRLWQVPHD